MNRTDNATARRLTFFPEIEPFRRGRLRVSDLHEIYFEECGNPQGKPVVILHGGPGGGVTPMLRRLHNPMHYRIILFDQRGCGNSTPYASLVDNTTWHLIEDMEQLRMELEIEQWQVFGGSWGATLALAYAQRHVKRVSELIVRGIFTVRDKEVRWFYQEGASMLFPEAFEKYQSLIPADERHDLVAAYYKRITGSDHALRLVCAKAWSQWEGSTLSLLPDPARENSFAEERFAMAFASIECHYFAHRGFFAFDGELLAGMNAINHLEGSIIQGRYDVVTPAETAFELAKRWPNATFEIINDAGHSTTEPGITNALIRASNRFI